MTEQHVAAATVTIASEVVKELAMPVYRDLAKPSAQQIGEALGTIFGVLNTALLPVALLNSRRKLWFDKLNSDLEVYIKSLPKDRFAPPPMGIATSIVTALPYAMESEDLRRMFFNLLATAIDSETVNDAHPAFADIIRGMSGDDAIIFTDFVRSSHKYIKAYFIQFQSGPLNEEYIQAHYEISIPNVYVPHSEFEPISASRSYQNLARLGLIIVDDRHANTHQHPVADLDPFLRSKFDGILREKPDTENLRVICTNRSISLSDWGKIFSKICLGIDKEN